MLGVFVFQSQFLDVVSKHPEKHPQRDQSVYAYSDVSKITTRHPSKDVQNYLKVIDNVAAFQGFLLLFPTDCLCPWFWGLDVDLVGVDL